MPFGPCYILLDHTILVRDKDNDNLSVIYNWNIICFKIS